MTRLITGATGVNWFLVMLISVGEGGGGRDTDSDGVRWRSFSWTRSCSEPKGWTVFIKLGSSVVDTDAQPKTWVAELNS